MLYTQELLPASGLLPGQQYDYYGALLALKGKHQNLSYPQSRIHPRPLEKKIHLVSLIFSLS
jgi:hypothetical protein